MSELTKIPVEGSDHTVRVYLNGEDGTFLGTVGQDVHGWWYRTAVQAGATKYRARTLGRGAAVMALWDAMMAHWDRMAASSGGAR